MSEYSQEFFELFKNNNCYSHIYSESKDASAFQCITRLNAERKQRIICKLEEDWNEIVPVFSNLNATHSKVCQEASSFMDEVIEPVDFSFKPLHLNSQDIILIKLAEFDFFEYRCEPFEKFILWLIFCFPSKLDYLDRVSFQLRKRITSTLVSLFQYVYNHRHDRWDHHSYARHVLKYDFYKNSQRCKDPNATCDLGENVISVLSKIIKHESSIDFRGFFANELDQIEMFFCQLFGLNKLSNKFLWAGGMFITYKNDTTFEKGLAEDKEYVELFKFIKNKADLDLFCSLNGQQVKFLEQIADASEKLDMPKTVCINFL